MVELRRSNRLCLITICTQPRPYLVRLRPLQYRAAGARAWRIYIAGSAVEDPSVPTPKDSVCGGEHNKDCGETSRRSASRERDKLVIGGDLSCFPLGKIGLCKAEERDLSAISGSHLRYWGCGFGNTRDGGPDAWDVVRLGVWARARGRIWSEKALAYSR